MSTLSGPRGSAIGSTLRKWSPRSQELIPSPPMKRWRSPRGTGSCLTLPVVRSTWRMAALGIPLLSPGDPVEFQELEAGLAGIGQAGQAVLWSRWAVFDAQRVTAAKVALEQLPVGTHPDCSAGAGIQAGQGADTGLGVNHYRPGLPVHIHRPGDGASLLAQGRSTVAADSDLGGTRVQGAVDPQAGPEGVDRVGLTPGAHQLTHATAIAEPGVCP